jgi:hypothetical protein
MDFSDEKMDWYIKRISDSNNSNNKLLNYKKAKKRLNELEQLYQCVALNKLDINNDTDINSDTNTNTDAIESITNNIEKITEKINECDNPTDMCMLLQQSISIKKKLQALEKHNKNFSNELYVVDKKYNEFSTKEIDINKFINT